MSNDVPVSLKVEETVPKNPRPGTTGGAQPVTGTHVYTLPKSARRPVPSTQRSGGTTGGAQPVAAGTHWYTPLKRDARSVHTVHSTQRPGGTSGAEPVYEDGDTFRGLGQPLNRDVLGAPTVPSTPRPARAHGGSVGDQTDSPNQPPDAAREERTIWEQLRNKRRGIAAIIIIIIASVVMVTLMVHVILVHTGSQRSNHDSPLTTNRGTDTTEGTAHVWQSPAVTVTSADVIMVDPTNGRGPPAAVSVDVTAAGPTQASTPLSVSTKEVPGGSSFIFVDESGTGNLRGARGVAVSPDNKIWVADQTKASLQVYSMAGAYLGQFPQGAAGMGYPSSKTTYDVSIDRDGHLWVLMSGYPASPDTVVQVDREGRLKAKFDLPDSVPREAPRGMAVGLRTNHVYVTWSGGYSGGVQAFQPDGSLLWEVGPQQRMMTPMYVAVNGEGNIFISDFRRHFIYMYDDNGQFKLKFRGLGRSGSNLLYPEGICADSSGHIMVVDPDNQRVVVYTDQGEYVRHIAVPRRAEAPVGVTVGPGGQLVVINKNTITVFPHY
ncbi:uncharacterized protein LOC144920493 [Branchiostoma floridae x Branchiostoma belcheri]